MAGGEGGAEDAAADEEWASVVMKLRFRWAASYKAKSMPSSPPL